MDKSEKLNLSMNSRYHMKRIILLITVIVFSFTSLSAQSLAGYKICINPGHGGHDSDDRFIAETGYWESEGNLTKGLYLRSILENLGATIYITRTGNNTSDDLPLSQIVAIANTNNVDYFHSIHSNATGTATKANYTLILFQGRTNAPTYAGSLTMANYLADKINKANRTKSKMVAGDFDFYGTGQPYLGVFKGLNMPGTLSEGSFHDYVPESWRLKNNSYLKHEAWAIARSFLQYFNGGNFTKGILAGIVRDVIETVPSSYSPLSGTLDNYKTVNKIKVTLQPDGKIYNGDEFNNGYYFFDELTPGNYTVIVEADKMRPDTSTVTVKTNESVFNDRMVALNPILDPPKIISYAPADSVNEVSNVSPIVIDFDIRMNTTETQNAFSITPAVSGTISWNAAYTKLTFTPTKSYVSGTKYLVTITTSAKTHFGINLPQKKNFSFTTRSKLNLVSTYPVSGVSNISTTVLMRLVFDKGIDASTLVQKISVVDSLGNLPALTANQAKYSAGIIEFESKVPLNNNTLYKITVREGIGDVEYVKFPQTVTIDFRTEKNYTFTGNILEGFETDNVWQSPLLSPNTKEVNASLTNFAIYNLRKKSGENSGKLEYGFSGSTGTVELALLNPIMLGESSAVAFGIWMFGDNSKNVLEYRFLRSSEEKVQLDTINWTGWKLKKILLNQIPGAGTIKFKSIVLVQSGIGNLSGKLFFDDCISNIITGVHEDNNIPGKFCLEQNYPNPFNPTTTIRFSIPNVKTGHAPSLQRVSLKVYDVLGREIATLVNEDKVPGNYEIKFNANGLASGIYFYRIKAGDFVQSKKMILLK